MKVKGYILCMCLALTAVAGYGQKTDRDYLRSGNKTFTRTNLFVKAEVDYRKALEAESQVCRCHVQSGKCADDAGKGQRGYGAV